MFTMYRSHHEIIAGVGQRESSYLIYFSPKSVTFSPHFLMLLRSSVQHSAWRHGSAALTASNADNQCNSFPYNSGYRKCSFADDCGIAQINMPTKCVVYLNKLSEIYSFSSNIIFTWIVHIVIVAHANMWCSCEAVCQNCIMRWS